MTLGVAFAACFLDEDWLFLAIFELALFAATFLTNDFLALFASAMWILEKMKIPEKIRERISFIFFIFLEVIRIFSESFLRNSVI